MGSISKASRKSAGLRSGIRVGYTTRGGRLYIGDSVEFPRSRAGQRLVGKVDLIFTSPPFPLVRKKAYGNLEGQHYINWLCEIVGSYLPLLSDRGSLVVELGNAWEKGAPVHSTLPLRALLALEERLELHVCQQFICNNPARMPGPIQWVNRERIRVKDTYTHVWWFARSERPEASNRRVLQPYSTHMRRLLDSGKYNSGKRPSEWTVGHSSFLVDNGGAIPGNVLTIPNTASATDYLRFCRERALPVHPARMPLALADFFIRFLTISGALVLDPFAGSNVSGRAAETSQRKWVAVERDVGYVAGSTGRWSRREVSVKDSELSAELKRRRRPPK